MKKTTDVERTCGSRVRVLMAGLLVALALIGQPDRAIADPAGDASVSADLVNETRAAYGLHRLIPDRELQVIANRQANRMADRGYAFHSGGLGHQLSWGWWAWGENVGAGPSVHWVHAAFLESGEHSFTMLSDRYNYFGVGVAYGGDGTVYVAHVFGAW